MLGIEPGTYIVSAQKREGFTEELEFEPRIENQVGIGWINQLEKADLSRKTTVGQGTWKFQGRLQWNSGGWSLTWLRSRRHVWREGRS